MTDVDLDAVAVPLDWRELFGRDAPTDVEIGSGKGRFLLALAASRPERNLLAVERAGAYHKMCCERAAKHGLGNIRLLRTTAEDLLFRLLRPSSVDTLFVLFPDPWPKKRHHKRRFLQSDNLEVLLRCLRPGGEIRIATDHADYFQQIQEVTSRYAGQLEEIEFERPAAAREGERTGTNYERKYVQQSRPIYTAAFRKRA